MIKCSLFSFRLFGLWLDRARCVPENPWPRQQLWASQQNSYQEYDCTGQAAHRKPRGPGNTQKKHKCEPGGRGLAHFSTMSERVGSLCFSLPTETDADSGTSHSKSGTSVNLGNSGDLGGGGWRRQPARVALALSLAGSARRSNGIQLSQMTFFSSFLRSDEIHLWVQMT